MSEAQPREPAWNALIESRKERADYYFKTILDGQDTWYSNKAGIHKKRHLHFAIAVIILGALISILQTTDLDVWGRYLTALLGVGVSIVRAIDTLLRPGEIWTSYRKACEGMKREYRLYVNSAEDYAETPDEDTAYRQFVERVESVIAEEQQLFWQYHPQQPKAPAAAQTTEDENSPQPAKKSGNGE